MAPILAFFLAVTLAGLDFGYHWDEGHGHLRPVRLSLERGTAPLPSHYIYPSLNYWINLGVLLPDGLAAWWHGEPVRPALLAALASDAWPLRQRAVRAVLSSVAIVWLYLLALALGRSRLEAWLAAAFLALSWEFGYHARWPAPDTILVQFGLLALLCTVMALRESERRCWPLFSAAAAALACATKYPGGLFLLFTLAAVTLHHADTLPQGTTWRTLLRDHWRGFLRAMRPSVLTFAGVFLAVVPGAIFEMKLFVSQLRYMAALYSHSADVYANISAKPGFDHLTKILVYLVRLTLSPSPAVALLLVAFALPGIVVLARTEGRRERRAVRMVFAFPIVYALYFCRQAIFTVRNYMVLIPFLALFVAVGLVAVGRRLPSGWRALLAAGVAGALVANAAFDVAALDTIRHRHDLGRFTAELAAYLGAHPETRFVLSARTADRLAAAGFGGWPNVRGDTAREDGGPRLDAVVCHLWELGDTFPSNLLWGGFTAVFGPREVNLDLYTTWRGDDRPLVLPYDRALELGLVMPQRIQRRLVFPGEAGRWELVRTGGGAGEEGADVLTVERRDDGTAVFDLEAHGDGRRFLRDKAEPPLRKVPVAPFEELAEPVAVESGRAYDLDVFWDVVAGHVEIRLDGRRVWARSADLVRYRLDELRVELP